MNDHKHPRHSDLDGSMSEPQALRRSPIAIVGMDVLFPGTPGRAGFWRDIVRGRDAIRDVPSTHWLIEDYYDPDPSAPDKTYCRRGGFLEPIAFDPMEFGIPPRSLPSIDTAQLLALVVARNVLADAAPPSGAAVDKARISVVLGVASATELVEQMSGRMQRPAWVAALREAGLPEDRVQAIADRIAARFPEWQESTFPGLLGNVVAGRIANRLDLGGGNYVTDAACASSFSAIQAAVDELHLGRSDMVLAGGVDALNDVLMYMCFSKTPAFSPTGDVRPFSDRADGTIIGEGLGIFALRRLADAERDGNQVYAVIRGIGRSSDGRATSVYAPRAEGQALAIARAYEDAGYAPSTVELVEAHGTGTVAGDAAEVDGLKRVFAGGTTTQRPWCALGSVKSQIGHTKAAAGAAGLFKVAMALHEKILPPTLKIERPNPKLELESSPFYLNTRARPWIRASNHPRRAAVSSFGFGGSNFHLMVEEYAGPGVRPTRQWNAEASLVLLSANSPSELAERASVVARDARETTDLAGFAAFIGRHFDPAQPARLAILAHDAAKLADALEGSRKAIVVGNEDGLPAGVRLGIGPRFAGKIAFLCSGQGSQYVGMGADLARTFDAARAVWDRAAGMAEFADMPLHDLAFPPPPFDDDARARRAAALTLTENAQPAIAAVSLAQLAVLRALGLEPHALAGHSFGEIVALHAAGIFDADTTLHIARLRGRAMAEASASHPGAMIAVSADRECVSRLLASWKTDVVIANDNSPHQVVLSGRIDAIDDALQRLAADRIQAVRLPVSTAFHSPVVASSVEPFRERLDGIDFGSPRIPVYATASAAPYSNSPMDIRDQVASQIATPVRFREQVEALYAFGARLFLEVGPGSVLTGLAGRCLEGRPHRAIALDCKNRDGVDTLLDAVAEFAALGIDLDYAAVQAEAPSAIPRPKAVPTHAVSIHGANFRKPYPPPGGAAEVPRPNPPSRPMSATDAFAASAIPSMSPTPTTHLTMPQTQDLESFHRQLAETHAAYQRAMADSHQAFLRVAEQTLAALTAGTGIHQPSSVSASLATVTRPIELSSMPEPLVPQPMPMAPRLPWSDESPVAPLSTPPAGVSARPAQTEAIAAARPSTEAATSTAAPIDATALVMAVVTEKTGYPADMLNLDMELEAELGVDSIKQVEIMSAIRERVVGLPEPDPVRLAELRTLRHIIAMISAATPAAKESAAGAPTAATPNSTSSPSPAARAKPNSRAPDAAAILLAIVTEKTGYPADMLNLDMDLEAELGIDSIKQVEILSALRERLPDLPEVDPSQMTALRNLRAILGFVGAAGGDKGAVAPSRPADSPATYSAATSLVTGTVARHVLGLVDRPASGFAMPALRAVERVGVASLGANTAISTAVVAELEKRGVPARLLTTPEEAVDALVLLDLDDPCRNGNESVASMMTALSWARDLARACDDGHGLFVTVHAGNGDFGLRASPRRAWRAGLPALVKTARREWPKADVKAIDVATAGRDAVTLARVIVDELTAGGPEIEVGLGADGRRQVPMLRVAELGSAGPSGKLRDRMVLVVSGGARGVTAQAMLTLARHSRLRLALLGRTLLEPEPEGFSAATDEASLRQALAVQARPQGKPLAPTELARMAGRILAGREIRATMSALESAGAEVRYKAVDVADMAAVARAVAEVRAEWGSIHGVIHAAGILADKRIRDKTPEQARRVLVTKIGGLAALLEATESDPLEAIVCFSSSAATFGNAGQADYAMANETLNKMAEAEARRRPECVVKSIAWGPWDGGMVRDGLRSLFHSRRIPLIPLAAGGEFLARELTAGDRNVEIVAGVARMGEEDVWRSSVTIDRQNHPFVMDHAIDDTPVLPMVLVLEWFHRFISAIAPGKVVRELRDVSVLKGVVFERGLDAPHAFLLTGRAIADDGLGGHFNLTLLDSKGRARYSARAILGDSPVVPPPIDASAGDPRPWPWSVDNAYRGPLFHGTMFRVLQSLDELTTSGGGASLKATDAMKWPGGPWHVDPATLDGGLQLARLWALDATGRVFLPTRIASVAFNGVPPLTGARRCTFRSHLGGESKSVSDISFADADGHVFTVMRDVEMYATSATPAAVLTAGE